ncbi:g2512 [Coccomyxa viridis]|uniref:G2512 protein n=1 Tax=Coccomyxa viridis TaxID=1274662 RepID=A0ABP1FPI4_9CHLO
MRMEALNQEERRARAASVKALELSRAREEQLEAFKARLLAERRAAVRDGVKVQEQALEHAQQESLKGEEKKERAMMALRETDRANQALLALKRQQKEEERLDDAKIAEYAARKAAQDEERAVALAAMAAAKEAQRRKIAEVMEHNFLKKQAESDTHHVVAAEEARLKEDNTAAEAVMRHAERATEIER